MWVFEGGEFEGLCVFFEMGCRKIVPAVTRRRFKSNKF